MQESKAHTDFKNEAFVKPKTAVEFLDNGVKILAERGIERDKPQGERSMEAIVTAFNAVTGHKLTEEQGWLFMVMLKAVRSQLGKLNDDHYIDGLNYFALAGEAACRDRK